MSVFTTNTIIERLEEEVESLKMDNDILKDRVVAMMKQHSETRKAAAELKQSLNDIINARDAEIAELKAQAEEGRKHARSLYDGYFVKYTWMSDAVEKRDAEIALLKKENEKLLSAQEADADTIMWLRGEAESAADEVISYKQEVTSLKKQLEDNRQFTESAIARASQTESDLFMKNAELHARLNMLTEESERQTQTVKNMEEQIDIMKQTSSMAEKMAHEVYTLGQKLATKEKELAVMQETNQKQCAQLLETQNELAFATKKLECITEASTYITKILSLAQ